MFINVFCGIYYTLTCSLPGTNILVLGMWSVSCISYAGDEITHTRRPLWNNIGRERVNSSRVINMDLLEIASNINKIHLGRNSMRAGRSVFSQWCISARMGHPKLFSGAHLNTCGALHIYLMGASRRAWGSRFSGMFSNLVPRNTFISIKYL